MVTRFASATDFDVNDHPVTTTGGIRFVGGAAADLALNVKVEVEGSIDSNGVLVAEHVNFHRKANVRIDGSVEAVDNNAGTFQVLGITVKVNANTRYEDKAVSHDRFITLSKLTVGDPVQVSGIEHAVTAGQVLATRVVREADPVTTVELRGNVASLSQPSFIVLTTTVTTTNTTVFDGIASAAFFGSVDHPLVKVRGTWDGATLTAQSVELEVEEEMHD